MRKVKTSARERKYQAWESRPRLKRLQARSPQFEIFADGADVVELVGDRHQKHLRTGGAEKLDGVAFTVLPGVALIGFSGAADELGHRVAEEALDLLVGDEAILDGIVQDGGDGEVFGATGLDEDLGDAEGMNQVRNARVFPVLAGVGGRGELDGVKD